MLFFFPPPYFLFLSLSCMWVKRGSQAVRKAGKEGGRGFAEHNNSCTPLSSSSLPLSPLTPPSGRYLSVIPGMPEITIASLRDTRPLGGVDPAVLHIPAIVGVEVEVEKGRERGEKKRGRRQGRSGRWADWGL